MVGGERDRFGPSEVSGASGHVGESVGMFVRQCN